MLRGIWEWSAITQTQREGKHVSEVAVGEKRARNFFFLTQLFILSDRVEKLQCHYFLAYEFFKQFRSLRICYVCFCLCNMQTTRCYLWHVVSDNCVGSSLEVFHQQVLSSKHLEHSFKHLNCPVRPSALFLRLHIEYSGVRCNPQGLEATLHICTQRFVFLTRQSLRLPSVRAISWF